MKRYLKFICFILVVCLSFGIPTSSLKAETVAPSGPGLVNEASEKQEPQTFEEALQLLQEGETSITNYFTYPHDLNDYRRALLPPSVTLNGIPIELNKLGIQYNSVEFHEMLFLFGWGKLTKEQKQVEASQPYIRYGMETTKIAQDTGILDVFSKFIVMLAQLIETASYYITAITAYVVSIATTPLISDTLYTIGDYINQSVFDWKNPGGAGIALLLILTLTGGIVKLMNGSKTTKHIFTFKGIVSFVISLVLTFSFAWITVSQGPYIINQIDKKLETVQSIIFNDHQEHMTSSMNIKTELFNAMQLEPYKFRTFGLRDNVSDEEVEQSFKLITEMNNKDLIKGIVDGTVNLLGSTAEFISLGAYDHVSSTEQVKSKINVVTGISDAIKTLFDSLLMLIVKVVVGGITLLFSLLLIVSDTIKQLSTIFAIVGLLSVFFNRNRSTLDWWVKRLQWSVFFMLINFMLTLGLAIVLKFISFVMRLNLFFGVLTLLIIFCGLLFTLKIGGKTLLKSMFESIKNNINTPGTVPFALKEAVFSGTHFDYDRSPQDIIGNWNHQRKRTSNKNEKEERYHDPSLAEDMISESKNEDALKDYDNQRKEAYEKQYNVQEENDKSSEKQPLEQTKQPLFVRYLPKLPIPFNHRKKDETLNDFINEQPLYRSPLERFKTEFNKNHTESVTDTTQPQEPLKQTNDSSEPTALKGDIKENRSSSLLKQFMISKKEENSTQSTEPKVHSQDVLLKKYVEVEDVSYLETKDTNDET